MGPLVWAFTGVFFSGPGKSPEGGSGIPVDCCGSRDCVCPDALSSFFLFFNGKEADSFPAELRRGLCPILCESGHPLARAGG